MKLLSVVGARPQFVKLGPVHRAIVARGHDHTIVHTGQHYDENMSDVFFAQLGIPQPDVNLSVGSATHGKQTSLMLGLLESYFETAKPDWVVVYGDTNSTLAAALAAVKMQIRVVHLEAGLRSFNRAMPEEHNRVLTDHASDLLLAPSSIALAHLANEGLGARALLVGDVMVDVCLETKAKVLKTRPTMPIDWISERHYYVATIHRQENTDDPDQLERVIGHLESCSTPIALLAHPRLRAKCKEFGIHLERCGIEVFEPLSYEQLVFAVLMSEGVVTDSGGLQKEAFLLGKPCVTLRKETEWVETVELGWNRLDAGLSLNLDDELRKPRRSVVNPYGAGDASKLVVQAIEAASCL